MSTQAKSSTSLCWPVFGSVSASTGLFRQAPKPGMIELSCLSPTARAYVHSRLHTLGGRRRAARCRSCIRTEHDLLETIGHARIMNLVWPVVRSCTMVSRPSSVSRTVTINVSPGFMRKVSPARTVCWVVVQRIAGSVRFAIEREKGKGSGFEPHFLLAVRVIGNWSLGSRRFSAVAVDVECDSILRGSEAAAHPTGRIELQFQESASRVAADLARRMRSPLSKMSSSESALYLCVKRGNDSESHRAMPYQKVGWN